MCFIPYAPDEVMRAMKETIDRIQPAVALDLHNWQNKHTDGLLGLDPAVRERFVLFMPDQLEFGKQWTIRDPKPLAEKAPSQELLRNYCERNFGAIAVTFEFPWFGRTTDDMRATGPRPFGPCSGHRSAAGQFEVGRKAISAHARSRRTMHRQHNAGDPGAAKS